MEKFTLNFGTPGPREDGLGWAGCPRLSDTPLLEPGSLSSPQYQKITVLFVVVTKKIAHERLTALVFRDECIVTACQVSYR